MISMYELKLGREKLEALQFLIERLNELETTLEKMNINTLTQASQDINASQATITQIKTDLIALEARFKEKLVDFENKKEVIDTKFKLLAPLVEQMTALKTEIEKILKQGVINDEANNLTQTLSSQKTKRTNKWYKFNASD